MVERKDHLVLLARALDQGAGAIAKIRPDQAAQPTPCRSFDVRALVNHLVDELDQFRKVTIGERRHHLGIDVIGDDWTGAYRAAADGLLEAWRRPGALERTQHVHGRDLPATWATGQHIAEVVMHTWDIAKATGQSTDLDPELGELAFDWLRENIPPEARGSEEDGMQIGPEVEISDDAPLYDRLAAFCGRDPG